MFDKDIAIAKIETVRRCLFRIHSVTGDNPATLDDFDIQDIVVLNLQRAVQSCVDISALIIASQSLGVPITQKEHFTILEQAEIVDHELAGRMRRLVGFRNIAIHDYQKINPDVLKSIVTNHLIDIEKYTGVIVGFMSEIEKDCSTGE